MGSWKSDWSRIGRNLTESVEDAVDLLDGASGSKFHVSDRVWKKVSEGTKSKKNTSFYFLLKCFLCHWNKKKHSFILSLGRAPSLSKECSKGKKLTLDNFARCYSVSVLCGTFEESGWTHPSTHSR